jgi:hypothetical protein
VRKNLPLEVVQNTTQLFDSDQSQAHVGDMTKLLEEAFEAARRLTPDQQDDIARAILQLAGSDQVEPVPLTPEEREAIARSKAAAARGEFATDEEVEAMWAKYAL